MGSVVQQDELVADISDYQATANLRRYKRAGRRMIILKAADAADTAGARFWAERAKAAHAVRLPVAHYDIVRYDVPPAATMHNLIERVRPLWQRGDRLMIDVEDYSGPPSEAAKWVDEAQHYLHSQNSPLAFGYTNEAYMAEAGKQLADACWGWIIAAYDGLLLGAGTPKLPRGTKAVLLGKQYTDGQLGAQPHVTPGIGPCDDSILTPTGQRLLYPPPPAGTKTRLRRPIRPVQLPKQKACC